MTLDEAEDLAARTLVMVDHAAIAYGRVGGKVGELLQRTYAADRERVVSDLAGLRRHAPDSLSGECGWCLGGTGEYDGWPCEDARAYADNLRRTAALYGVDLVTRIPGLIDLLWRKATLRGDL